MKTVHLRPAPLHLLAAIGRGAMLRRYSAGDPFILIRSPRPRDEFDNRSLVHARAANALIRLSLIGPINGTVGARPAPVGHGWRQMELRRNWRKREIKRFLRR